MAQRGDEEHHSPRYGRGLESVHHAAHAGGGRECGKKLQRLRREKVEHSLAHLLETGGARRTWLQGQ